MNGAASRRGFASETAPQCRKNRAPAYGSRNAHDHQMPKAISALVPEYLPAVPIDPYSGQEIRYRRDGDRVATYSVGRNRKDDGGQKLGEGPSRRWGIYREDEPPPDIGLAMRVSGGSN